MKKSNVVSLMPPEDGVEDVLTSIVRQGAHRLLAAAIEAEVEEFIGWHQDVGDEMGRRRVVRNGYLPEREIQTGIGAVKVRVPRVRDRAAEGEENRVRFCSKIVPRYLRRSRSLEDFLPVAVEVTRRVNEVAGLEVAHVVPVKRIPKTTSGKIQRVALERAFLDGEFAAELAELARLREVAHVHAHDASGSVERRIKAIVDDALHPATSRTSSHRSHRDSTTRCTHLPR